ncbi:MAG: hypothetical protein K2N72_07425 [Oscillospiraceae bacterium]|nr:hypothetical protein [Oscillospiraceae bacterium]
MKGGIFTDDLIFKKIWQDEHMLELKITAVSESIKISSEYYITPERITEIGTYILQFISGNQKQGIITAGTFGGNNAPAFAMQMNCDKCGHILLDITMELNDNARPKHQCSFYIKTEPGLFEKFARSLNGLIYAPLDTQITF